MIITWNGVYNRIGAFNVGKRAYEIFTNSVERCSLIYNESEGIVFQADWKDQRWKTLLQNRRKSELMEILNSYAEEKIK